ncbi:MAG: hypothetical protein GY788_32410 [bacterium]|nr:hypothetical protein [bacterium]
MTPDEQELVMKLVIAPGRDAMPRAEFLEEFGADDGPALGLRLLRDAVDRRDPDDVELALIVCFVFGFSEEHLPLLLDLSFADWHFRHEDIVWALKDYKSPEAIDALMHAAQSVPGYLEWDEARALASKAIWALSAIDGRDAERALESLVLSDHHIVADGATAQLARRRQE